MTSCSGIAQVIAFAFNAFAVGVLAALGLVLVAAGLLAGAHYAERRATRTSKEEGSP